MIGRLIGSRKGHGARIDLIWVAPTLYANISANKTIPDHNSSICAFKLKHEYTAQTAQKSDIIKNHPSFLQLSLMLLYLSFYDLFYFLTFYDGRAGCKITLSFDFFLFCRGSCFYLCITSCGNRSFVWCDVFFSLEKETSVVLRFSVERHGKTFGK